MLSFLAPVWQTAVLVLALALALAGATAWIQSDRADRAELAQETAELQLKLYQVDAEHAAKLAQAHAAIVRNELVYQRDEARSRAAEMRDYADGLANAVLADTSSGCTAALSRSWPTLQPAR